MSWNNVDNKHKLKYDRNYVSCEEYYEREFIINTILYEFPNYSKERVKAVIENCCRTIPAPRDRVQFLRCVQSHL